MDDSSSSAAPPNPHRHAWDLIPWLVNGTASAADRALAEAHLAVCSDCSDELARQRQWHAGMHADPAVPHDPAPALQRLWSRIDRVEGDTLAEPRGPAARPLLGRRLGWTRWLAAAVVLQTIGLAALIGVVWERPRSGDYVTLGRPSTVPPGATIRLVPAPEAQVGALQTLLAQQGLQIVGSSDDGRILSLAPRADAAALTAADLARLRAAPGVLLAEPIGDAMPALH